LFYLLEKEIVIVYSNRKALSDYSIVFVSPGPNDLTGLSIVKGPTAFSPSASTIFWILKVLICLFQYLIVIVIEVVLVIQPVVVIVIVVVVVVVVIVINFLIAQKVLVSRVSCE